MTRIVIQHDGRRPELTVCQREIDGRVDRRWSILCQSFSGDNAVFLATGIAERHHAVSMAVGLALRDRFDFEDGDL